MGGDVQRKLSQSKRTRIPQQELTIRNRLGEILTRKGTTSRARGSANQCKSVDRRADGNHEGD